MRTLGRRITDKTLSENVCERLGEACRHRAQFVSTPPPLRMRDSASCADHPHGDLYRLANMS